MGGNVKQTNGAKIVKYHPTQGDLQIYCKTVLNREMELRDRFYISDVLTPQETKKFQAWFRRKAKIQERLEYLRGEIRTERISYSEIAELQSLKKHIKPSDTELAEWAGIPEGIR